VDYLSDYAALLSFSTLPAEVVHHTKRMVIDTLGAPLEGISVIRAKWLGPWLLLYPADSRQLCWAVVSKQVWNWPHLPTG